MSLLLTVYYLNILGLFEVTHDSFAWRNWEEPPLVIEYPVTRPSFEISIYRMGFPSDAIAARDSRFELRNS